MFLLYFFCNRILSYFAEPNFIIYDEWFDEDLEKTGLNIKNKKIKTTENLHEFFMNYQIIKLALLKIICN